jgi:hypothetical protein
MSCPPPDYPWRANAKAVILTRVAAGETVRAACRDEAMPCPESVTNWRRADAGFAAALDAARARGELARRRLAFDAAVAQAFLARMADGARVDQLLARPGMPSQAAYRYWRRTNAEFQAEVWRLSRVKDAVRAQMRAAGIAGGGGRPFRPFDQGVADRILLAVMRGAQLRRMLETDPSMPSRKVVYRWRWEEPLWDRALRMAMKTGRLVRERARSLAPLTPELTEEIATRVALGASLRSLGAEPDMPCPHTLYMWVERSAAFAEEMIRAEYWRDEFLNDQMVDICQRNGPFGLAATKREAHPLQWRANQLAKRPGWKRRRLALAERCGGAPPGP